jgi:hypothetical protein
MRTQLLKTLLKFVAMTQSLIIDLKRMMMRWDSLTFLVERTTPRLRWKKTTRLRRDRVCFVSSR